jgi:hypothetical protein
MKVPVPVVVIPVALISNCSVPKTVKPIRPEPGLYMPDDVSEEKFSVGDPEEPLDNDKEPPPAETVAALSKFTESQSKIACELAGTTADELPAMFVVKVIV